jgi:hypothetical protein
MATKESVLVEFGDDHCRDIFLAPLDRRMRGRFEAQQVAKFDRDAGSLISEWPDPVAGQQLEINTEVEEAAVIEPLHDFPQIAARIKGKGLRLAPARERVQCDFATLVFYVKAAVAAKQARVIRGTLPDVDESKVRRDLFVTPQESPTKTLATAMAAQAAAFNRLADVLEKTLAKR